MFRRALTFLAMASAWGIQASYLTNNVSLPVFWASGRSRVTGVAKARREKRRRRAKK